MSTTVAPTTYSPEDLLRMPDGDRFELFDGKLVEPKWSTLASFVAGTIFRLIANYCYEHKAGWPFPEGTAYRCFPHAPDRVRKADVSVFLGDRRSLRDFQAESHCPLAPDLAVEVISPNDEVYDVDTKVQDWLDAGVRCVWVVNPLRRTVGIHRSSGAGTILRETDELTGEDAVPGFRCLVSDFFKAPAKQSSES
jgi:Uma2 family endonuclease